MNAFCPYEKGSKISTTNFKNLVMKNEGKSLMEVEACLPHSHRI